MDKKDERVLKVASDYVVKLHDSYSDKSPMEEPNPLWRSFWNHEGTLLAVRKGK
jgi:hypothetical protein